MKDRYELLNMDVIMFADEDTIDDSNEGEKVPLGETTNI